MAMWLIVMLVATGGVAQIAGVALIVQDIRDAERARSTYEGRGRTGRVWTTADALLVREHAEVTRDSPLSLEERVEIVEHNVGILRENELPALETRVREAVMAALAEGDRHLAERFEEEHEAFRQLVLEGALGSASRRRLGVRLVLAGIAAQTVGSVWSIIASR